MKVCVFCGSGTGINPIYAESARKFGYLLAKKEITLVYGGGKVGLMGIVADAVMQNGGEVIGVIPDFLLKREVGHQGISCLEVVESMHQRKKRMADLADAFVALPGGWGTLEELSEILTWRQLDLMKLPVALLNINNFFDPLLHQMRIMIQEGFLKAQNFELLTVASSPEKLIPALFPEKG